MSGENDDRGHNEGCSWRYVCADSGPFVRPLPGKQSTGMKKNLRITGHAGNALIRSGRSWCYLSMRCPPEEELKNYTSRLTEDSVRRASNEPDRRGRFRA